MVVVARIRSVEPSKGHPACGCQGPVITAPQILQIDHPKIAVEPTEVGGDA